MSKTLNQFIGSVKGGLARTSHFAVSFVMPKCLDASRFGKDVLEKVLLFCEQTQLPGLNVATTPIRTWGETREMPYERMYEPITFTFYVDKEMKVKLFFDQWITSIQDNQTRHMNFYENYIVDVNVEVYDVADNSRYKATLFEAYPKTISAVEMNYGGKDVMRVQVTFAYRYWTTNQMSTVTSASGIIQPTGLGKIVADVMEVPNKIWNVYNTGDWQNALKSMDLPSLF